MNLIDIAHDLFARAFDQDNRPLRLRFPSQLGKLFEGALVPQLIDIQDAVCDDLTAHITCLTARSDLPLTELLGLPIEVQIVTDTGELRRVCVVITHVCQGKSDGSLTTLQLTGRDIFAVMEGRSSNRIFLNKSALDIARLVLDRWRKHNPALARAFDYLLLNIDESLYPKRALTFQCHQNDADFLRSLLRRNGIAWFVRPGPDGGGDTPAQQLVLFDNARELPENSACAIKYHRRDGTEPRDTVSLLAPSHTLVSGNVARSSWDHEAARVDVVHEASAIDQGTSGNELAAALVDSRIQLPHAGDTWADHRRLTRIDMTRHEGRAHCLHGVGGVRAQAVGEWNQINGHPLLDTLAPQQREYVTVGLQLWAQGSLPKELNERAQALLGASEASIPGWVAPPQDAKDGGDGSQHRFTNKFIAVRRDMPITPSWNPQTDLPHMPLMTGTVISEDGRPVLCDALGRVKVRIHGLDPVDEEGQATDTTAWVRVNFLWCGDGFGVIFPLRPGMEVSLGFELGDPSRPMIVGSRYAHDNPPPRFDHLGSLPANAAESGIVTRELNGARQQQLRFNDSTGNVSVQLGTDHAATQLNIGSLGTPMNEGQTDPRGEGGELRSDAALALRGGQGVLISSAKQTGANGPQLARAELVGLAQTLQAIVEQLGQLADTHHTSGTDPARFRQLVQHLQDWEKGSNTAPNQGPGGAPIVALSAVAGAGIVSQDNLVLGAQTNVDVVSAGHTQLTAGKQIRQRAETGVSLFAHTGGVEAIAGKGLVDVQAHQGDIHLTASGTINLTAGAKVIIQAPEVQVISQGTQTQWSGGSIVEQASGAYVVKASSFAQTSGGNGVPAGVNMPSSDLKFDQQVTLRWLGTNEPMKNQRYRITTETGQTLEGRTDANGLTERFPMSLAYGQYAIQPLND